MASNILILVDTGYAGTHYSKYWMLIHYDAIEDGQNKKSNLLFSNFGFNLNFKPTFHCCTLWRWYKLIQSYVTACLIQTLL